GGLSRAESLLNRYGAALGGLHSALGRLIAVEPNNHIVDAGRQFDARGSKPSGGVPIDKNFPAGRRGFHIGKSDASCRALSELGVKLRLHVVFTLHAANVGIVSGKAQYQVVL